MEQRSIANFSWEEIARRAAQTDVANGRALVNENDVFDASRECFQLRIELFENFALRRRDRIEKVQSASQSVQWQAADRVKQDRHIGNRSQRSDRLMDQPDERSDAFLNLGLR
jgi:hypothetical protein